MTQDDHIFLVNAVEKDLINSSKLEAANEYEATTY
jgi:hypothetical protein